MDRLVVGGGFSGLLAAWTAQRAGESVTVVEKSPGWGGMVSPVRLGDFEVDSGAEAFSVVGDSVLQLIADLGLSDEVVYPEDRAPHIVTAEGSFPIPAGVMGIPSSLEHLGSIPGMTEAVIHRARTLDSLPLTEGWEALSVAELVLSRLGPEILHTIVEPLCSGVHSCSPEEIEARAIFPDLVEALKRTGSLVQAASSVRGPQPRPGSAVATLSGGLFRLVDALVQNLTQRGAEMFSDTAVTSLIPQGGGWRVQTHRGPLRARRVSVCVGPIQAQELLAFIPEISEELGGVRTVDQALSVVVLRAPQLNDYPLGSGALVAQSVGIEAKAVTHLNAKWRWWQDALPRDYHALRFSFGRGGILPEGPHGQRVNEALERLFGLTNTQKVASRDIVWRAGTIRPILGHLERVARLNRAVADRGLSLHGSYMSGNGLLGITRNMREELHVTEH